MTGAATGHLEHQEDTAGEQPEDGRARDSDGADSADTPRTAAQTDSSTDPERGGDK